MNTKTLAVLPIILSLLITSLFPSMFVRAEEATSIHLQVETADGTLYDEILEVSECMVAEDPEVMTLNAKCALEQAGLDVVWSMFGDDAFLDSIEGVTNDFDTGAYWGWWTDLEYGMTALNKHVLTDGEDLLVTISVFPLKIEANPLSPFNGATTTVTVSEFGFDAGFNGVWNLSESAMVHAGDIDETTGAEGTATIGITSLDPFDVFASKDGFVDSNSLTITPFEAPPAPVSIDLKVHGAEIPLFSGPVSVSACPNSEDGATLTINGLCAFDAAEIPVELTWFSFGAQVDSIGGVAAGEYPDSWLWFLNDQVAQTGIASYEVIAGDRILWAKGIWPLKFSVSTTSPEINSTTTITVLGFDPLAFDFIPVPDAMVDGADITTDGNGLAEVFATSTDPLTITVTKAGFIATSTITIAAIGNEGPEENDEENEPPPTTGGGGGGITHIQFNVPAALSFLASKQGADGSFGALLYSDWAAIAFGSSPAVEEAETKLKNYLLTASPSLTSVTDYERHAMALMALGINPYSGTGVNYIAPIVSAFDGTQIGSTDLVNDDIFAIFPLLKAGYSGSDDIIQKTVAFIISKQGASGSWGDPDVTAAGIQALSRVSTLTGVESAISKAKMYLKNDQRGDAGFGNSFSTSWVMQGIAALGESQEDWSKNGFYPEDYLSSIQQSDGGVDHVATSVDIRVWATAYAIPAAEGKVWSDILHSFAKPSETTGGGGGGQSGQGGMVLGTSTPTLASSTPSVATSTPATSTPSVIEMIEEPQAPFKELVMLADQPTPTSNEESASFETPSEEIPIIIPEPASTSAQVAAVATSAESDTAYLLILPFLLIVAALLSALAFGPFLRFFREG